MRSSAVMSVVVLLTALVASAGCGQASGESAGSPTPASSSEQAVSGTQPETTVARIVFIDQEQACECTRDRIEASWTALQAALGEGSAMQVERIHRDTQQEQAEEYRLLRPMVTVPGIYLLDEGGAIVELLQGEVTEQQLRAALEGQS